uniref:Uncharacterized protein n=1 Tax=Sphaerodactylus townsendi TaxID=933632 RepID=A0ACB8GBU3_9SAUR
MLEKNLVKHQPDSCGAIQNLGELRNPPVLKGPTCSQREQSLFLLVQDQRDGTQKQFPASPFFYTSLYPLLTSSCFTSSGIILSFECRILELPEFSFL